MLKVHTAIVNETVFFGFCFITQTTAVNHPALQRKLPAVQYNRA
jgi:hypothetical protein